MRKKVFYLTSITVDKIMSRWCLLTPWCRVLLEKLTGLQLVKKFPAFHGTRRFITALTSVRKLFLSWASPIQFKYPHPTSWRSSLILPTHLHLDLPIGLLAIVGVCSAHPHNSFIFLYLFLFCVVFIWFLFLFLLIMPYVEICTPRARACL